MPKRFDLRETGLGYGILPTPQGKFVLLAEVEHRLLSDEERQELAGYLNSQPMPREQYPALAGLLNRLAKETV